MDITAELNDCSIHKWYDTKFYVLTGTVASKDSKGRFKVGTQIRTSHILKVEGDLVITRNSLYKVNSWKGDKTPDILKDINELTKGSEDRYKALIDDLITQHLKVNYENTY